MSQSQARYRQETAPTSDTFTCPQCGGDPATYTDGPVKHYYCPDCRPDYQEPVGGHLAIERALSLALLMTVAFSYPIWRPIITLARILE